MSTVDIQPTKHSGPGDNRPLAGEKKRINLLIRAKGGDVVITDYMHLMAKFTSISPR